MTARECAVNLELWILFRLLVAGTLGGLVGYERETTGKRAGLRTHMLVAMGATLFVSCNELALEQASRQPAAGPDVQVQVQVTGAVQAVATGIGFLGAGTIFIGGRRNRVRGLTTAASIWIISAVGLAVGFDRYLLAIGATLLIFFVLRVLVRLEPPHDAEVSQHEPPAAAA
jgi:putative Mg2+ transporter-C (MgtC) family protein